MHHITAFTAQMNHCVIPERGFGYSFFTHLALREMLQSHHHLRHVIEPGKWRGGMMVPEASRLHLLEVPAIHQFELLNVRVYW